MGLAGSRGAAADGSNVGFDTLEEEEEKKRFFANLQAGVSSPLDYSELIGELDSTGSTTGKDLGYLQLLDLVWKVVRVPVMADMKNQQTGLRLRTSEQN